MTSVRWYTVAMVLSDLYIVLHVWITGTHALSDGTVWFDRNSNSPLGALVFTAAVAFLTLPLVFVVIDSLNRWLLLNAAIAETVRLLLFSLLFKYNGNASQYNTLLLTFMAWNVAFYWRNWYTTMSEMVANMKKE